MKTRTPLLGALCIAAAGCADSPVDTDSSVEMPALRFSTHGDCASAADVRARIDDLEADGTLNQGRATALRAKLDQAERHEARGSSVEAAEAYEALVEQVEAWVAGGAITEAEAEELLACVEDVLDGPDTGPTIDGVKGPGEWDGATTVTVFAVSATFYYMNDAENLYVALEVPDPGGIDRFFIRFDNDLDGVDTVGDDALEISLGIFSDQHGEPGSWGLLDTSQDGTGAAGTTGGVNFLEIAHPLDSGDPSDFSLEEGDMVGYCLNYGGPGLISDWTYPSVDPFANCTMVVFGQSLYAVMTID